MSNRSKKGKYCSSTCQTLNHLTFGECVRSKGLQLNPNLSDTQASKAWDGELQAYRDAVGQGIQPAGTKMHQIRKAEEISQRTGVAYQAA